MEYFLFCLGFVVLIGGATVLIEGARSISKKLGIPPGITGLTIVAIGTSLPELIINVFASAQGSTDLAISNVLGSNIINILVIIGLTAILSPIPVLKNTYYRDIPFSLFAIGALFLVVQDKFILGKDINVVGLNDGFVFTGMLIVFLIIYYRSISGKDEKSVPDKRPTWQSILFMGLGIVGLYFGGDWIVNGAIFVASQFGMDEATIGLTIVAMATSLPELVTSIIASVKGEPEMAIGNAVGSCIFNIFLVLGVSAMISPLPFQDSSILDMIMVLVATITLVVFIYTGKGRKISRVEGGLMVLLYVTYMIYTLSR